MFKDDLVETLRKDYSDIKKQIAAVQENMNELFENVEMIE